MPRARWWWLAGVVLGLACHPNGASVDPGSRRAAKAERQASALGVIDLAVGRYRTCAVRSGGELRCWGDNDEGALGDGTLRTRRLPHPVLGQVDAVQVAVGPEHTCARHRDGQVSCWGHGADGQLGDGTLEDRRVPVRVLGIRDAIDVGVGPSHSCAVQSDGSAWCWGEGGSGQLGDGDVVVRSTPVRVKGLGKAQRVFPARGATCAWLRDDTVWCWGSDAEGLTGQAEPAPRCSDSLAGRSCVTTPKAPVPLPPVVDLAVGDEHACAVLRSGELRCWGDTFTCEHGVSELDPVRIPRALSMLPPISTLVGPQCARARSGELICWDRAPAVAYDDVWEDTVVCSITRVLPELTRDAVRISAHARGGCALRPGGSLWCWGDGHRGRLGDGGEVSRPEGVEVTALHQPPPPPGPTPMRAMTQALVEQAGTPREGFGLVWHDAPIFATAEARDPVGSLLVFDQDRRGDSRSGRLPVRIHAAHGSRVEVEPLGERSVHEHCGGSSFRGFDRYDLRMVVEATDLAPVITREYAMGFPDGTGVTLGAGVPLHPIEAGVVVKLDRLVVPLELAPGDAGLAYAMPGLETRTDVDAPWWQIPRLAPGAVLTLDDRPLHPTELPELLTHVIWARPEQRGVMRVHLEDRCVALDVLADEPVPTDDRGGGGAGMIGGGGTKTVTFHRIREAAPAFWPGGAPAGRLRESYRTREVPRPDGERRCFGLAGTLSICHDPADLSTETVELPRWSRED